MAALVGPSASLDHYHSSEVEALSLEHILLCVANAVSNSLIDAEIRQVVAEAAVVSWACRAVGRLVALVVAAAVAVAIENVEVQCFCRPEHDSLQQLDCFVAVARCSEVQDSRHVDLDEVDSLDEAAREVPSVDLAASQRDCASACSVRDCMVDLADCLDRHQIDLEAHIVVNTEIVEDMDPFACKLPSVACAVDSLAACEADQVDLEVLDCSCPFVLPLVNPD